MAATSERDICHPARKPSALPTAPTRDADERDNVSGWLCRWLGGGRTVFKRRVGGVPSIGGNFASGAFRWRLPSFGSSLVERRAAVSSVAFRTLAVCRLSVASQLPWADSGRVRASMLSRTLLLLVADSSHGTFAGGASGSGFQREFRDVGRSLVERDVAITMSVSAFRKLRRLSGSLRFPSMLSKR